MNPGGLFSGGLIHAGMSFPFQKLVPKHPGAYTRWSLLSEFCGMVFRPSAHKHGLKLKDLRRFFINRV